LPPLVKRRVGRPRKRRILSIGERKNNSKCSRCHGRGHNCRTCKLPPVD